MNYSRSLLNPFLIIIFSVIAFLSPRLFGIQVSFSGLDIVYNTNIFVLGIGLSTVLALNNLTYKNIVFLILGSFIFFTLDVFSMSLMSLFIVLVNKKFSFNILKLLSLFQFVIVAISFNDVYLLSFVSIAILYTLFFSVDLEHRLFGILLQIAIVAEACNSRYMELCVLISFLVLCLIMTSGYINEKKLNNIFFLALSTYSFLVLLGYIHIFFPFLIFLIPVLKKESLSGLSPSLLSTFLFLMSIVMLVILSQLELMFFVPVLLILLIGVKRIIDISRNNLLSNEVMIILLMIVSLSLFEIKTKGLL